MGRPRDDDDDYPIDDGWAESTEGDLDPDLTEEAGYLAWEPGERRNNWFPLVARIVIAIVILALIGTAILPALI